MQIGIRFLFQSGLFRGVVLFLLLGAGIGAFIYEEAEQADILILGPGCKNCQGLEQNVREALKKMGRDVEIAHVTDFGKIAAYGIMSTPGLVVKGKVLSSGKVLKADAIVELLEKKL